ncbi:MAG: putative deacylase [Planctomycetota bacterium]|jgi:predicted deacylase
MTATSIEFIQATTPMGRPDLVSHQLGVYETGRPGPLFIFVGGLHGNEPCGVIALQEILQELRLQELPLRGRLVCIAGNLEALRRGERYIDQDLNRSWAAGSDEEDDSVMIYELAVQRELKALIEKEIENVSESVVFLDLHSTSAGGSPFSIIGDTRQNRRIAFAFPVPVILGLEEAVDGSLLGFFGERGHIAIGFEGGQHEGQDTVRNHVAAIWITLVKSGGLLASETSEVKSAFDQLRAVGNGNPGVIELRYCHRVETGDEFVMHPGFSNFDPVVRGQALANDVNGKVRSREDGLVLLPLYQGQGDDGFFVGREIRRFWLRVSSVMRVLQIGSIVHWLPGVRRVPNEAETLEVNPKVAIWWVVEIFHLLGFRRLRVSAGKLRFSRRVEGLPDN